MEWKRVQVARCRPLNLTYSGPWRTHGIRNILDSNDLRGRNNCESHSRGPKQMDHPTIKTEFFLVQTKTDLWIPDCIHFSGSSSIWLLLCLQVQWLHSHYFCFDEGSSHRYLRFCPTWLYLRFSWFWRIQAWSLGELAWIFLWFPQSALF